MAKKKITADGTDIRFYMKGKVEYLCITDIAKRVNRQTDIVIQTWLRAGSTIDYLGTWEMFHNPNFKPSIYDGIKKQTGFNNFFLSVKQWVEAVNAIGIESRAGRYGGTYAHADIAFEFMSWLSPTFKLYVIKEFQRLKKEEAERKNVSWTVRRELAKMNHHIHIESIRQGLIPKRYHYTKAERPYFATEVDLINEVVFGITAREWRRANPKAPGENMRDNATSDQLAVIANIQSHNSQLILQGVSREERYLQLCAIADYQLSVIAGTLPLKNLESYYK